MAKFKAQRSKRLVARFAHHGKAPLTARFKLRREILFDRHIRSSAKIALAALGVFWNRRHCKFYFFAPLAPFGKEPRKIEHLAIRFAPQRALDNNI